MLKFIHCADLHLNRVFSNVNITNEHILEKLTSSTEIAWNNIIQSAINNEVNFIAISGDVFDSETPDIATQLNFVKSLEQLAKHNIQAFIIAGNHDPLNSWSNSLKFPKNVKIFSDQVDEHIEIFNKNNQHIANVLGISFKTKQQPKSVVDKFYKYITKNDLENRTVPNIALLHCDIVGVNNSAELKSSVYAPTTISELNNKKMIDYWALGHVHSAQKISVENSHDNSLILYSGIMQGRSANDVGEKGCWLLKYSENDDRTGLAEPWQLEFIVTSVVNYHKFQLILNEDNFSNEFNHENITENIEFISALIETDVEHELHSLKKIASPDIVFIMRCELSGRINQYYQKLIMNYASEILEKINDNLNINSECYLEKITTDFKLLHDYEQLKNSSPFFVELDEYFLNLDASLADNNDLLVNNKKNSKVNKFFQNNKILDSTAPLTKRALELFNDDELAEILQLARSSSFNYTLDEED